MKRLLKYLSGVLPFFAAEGIQLVAASIISLILSIATGLIIGIGMALKGKPITDELTKAMTGQILSQNMLYFISVLSVLICGIVFFFWYRHITKGMQKDGFQKLFAPKNVGVILLLGLGLQGFISGCMGLIQPYFEKLFSDYTDTISSLVSGNIVLVVLFAVVIAPITEELIFRGLILQKTSRVIPFVGANILQAILFGIYHWNIVQGIYAFVLGLFLGYTCRKYRTIAASMLLHMSVNACAFLIMVLPESYLSTIVTTAAGGILIAICLILWKNTSIKQVSNVVDPSVDNNINEFL